MNKWLVVLVFGLGISSTSFARWGSVRSTDGIDFSDVGCWDHIGRIKCFSYKSVGKGCNTVVSYQSQNHTRSVGTLEVRDSEDQNPKKKLEAEISRLKSFQKCRN